MRLEVLARPLNRSRLHVRDEKLGAIGGEQAAEVASHPAETLDRDLHTLEPRASETELHGSFDPEINPERRFWTGIAARLARCSPEPRDVARRTRDVRHVGEGRADVLGG